jgi:hypothetical protein
MNVPLESTQPPARELVSYDDFLGRLEALKASPRVRVEKVGQSNGRRGIYCILIGDGQAIPQLEKYKTLSASLQKPCAVHTKLFELETVQREELTGDMRFPVLVTGLSFGHEAAHVEAQLQLAERLAWSRDEETRAILARLIVLIMPMLNPDGRMMAIETWQRYPYAADSAAGNLYGFYLNRDFLHVSQPETRSVARVFKEWHPLALLDTHEDVFILGIEVPEPCWCPANGLSTVEEAPANIKDIVQSLAEAIHDRWQVAGFNDFPADLFAWTRPTEAAEEAPKYVASGNIVQTMSIRGIPAIITESARTPGVQTWQDRLQQKYLAGIAFLKTVAEDPERIARIIYNNRQQAIKHANESGEAFVIPRVQKEQAALSQLVGILIDQDVQIYETNDPYPAFVIPAAQAEAEIVRALLSTQGSKVLALPPALGVAITRYDALPSQEQTALKNATLRPVSERPLPTVIMRTEASGNSYAIPNVAHGIRLVNRLWSAGVPVRWLSESSQVNGQPLDSGTFVVTDISPQALEMLSQGLALDIQRFAPDIPLKTYELRQPRVAFYTGQGVNGHDASARADVWWALDKLGFGFVAVEAEDINPSSLARYDILIVPGGDVQEIVNGWRTNSLLNSAPWEMPGEPRGIGKSGLDAIRGFVTNGGTYLGIDGGGGLLALKDYADLIDLEIIAHTLGFARVVLHVDQPDHPLMFGLNGCYNDSGQWQPGFLPAFYYSDRFEGTPGGAIFHAGKDVIPLATYYRVDHDPARHQVIREPFLTDQERGLAIALQKQGKGQAAIIGLRPGFRAVWTYTWKLLSNAIFLSVAEETRR